eukprot:GHVQ01026530.1.p1 GENE.GHVQ01026530.1~~GHVQ01026530.1.p1  ORF type:complete len:264 (-),score=15.03 GHVQ01026530.1:1050-1841(-)
MGQWITYFRRKSTEEISFEGLALDISRARFVVALTGAGVSADSGIPTFRDPQDGLWQKYDPSTYATIWGFWRHPEKIWELIRDFLQEHDPKPNDSHMALSEMEKMGFLQAIVTQNVDNLHQEAGSTKVVEFHGNLLSEPFPINKSLLKDESFNLQFPPKCRSCGGNVKPDAVLFGESIPAVAVRESNALIRKCDLLLVVGTSASVSPASDLPYTAMRNGATVIEINVENTTLTNRISDKIVHGKSSGILKTIKRLREMEHSRG